MAQTPTQTPTQAPLKKRTGREYLKPEQIEILQEALALKSGGLALPVGSGKTLISLVLALEQIDENEMILVVASKTLIGSWEKEINKFFHDETPITDMTETKKLSAKTAKQILKHVWLKFEILHSSMVKKVDQWEPRKDTRIVLVTPNMVGKTYTEHDIESSFIRKEYPFWHNGQIFTRHYNVVKTPYLTHSIGPGVLFSKRWGCVIMDEAPTYCNAESAQCCGISAICTRYRWALSGTLFSEPKDIKILGYYILIDHPTFPRNLPQATRFIRSYDYTGLMTSCVYRASNAMFHNPPQLVEKVIEHPLDPNEQQIYLMMRSVLLSIRRELNAMRYLSAEERRGTLKRFTSYFMVMIMYLRQCVINAVFPLATIAYSCSNSIEKDKISHIINAELEKLHITEWLNNVEAAKSSRIRAIMNESENVDKDKLIIIFTCHRPFIDMLRHYYKKEGRATFTFASSSTPQRRNGIISEFEKSKNGILLLTFSIGAEGLNLQFCHTVYMADFWWNADKTQQGIGRVFRYGQQSPTVHAKFFTSNSGIEDIVFRKQSAKQQIVDELKYGKIQTKVPQLNLNQIIRFIEIHPGDQKAIDTVKHH